MTRIFRAVVAAVVSLAFVPAARTAVPSSATDQVVQDRSGRELLRRKTLPDGGTEISRVTWSGAIRRAVVTERADATGHVVHRERERFDDRGRLAERVAVDVDVAGHEQGWRKAYHYDEAGVATERTVALK